jgi:hypothetical protein
MNTRENKVWEGEGLLWQNLAIYETSEGMVGVLSNSKSFMNDKEIKFPDDLRPFGDLVAEIQKQIRTFTTHSLSTAKKDDAPLYCE